MSTVANNLKPNKKLELKRSKLEESPDDENTENK